MPPCVPGERRTIGVPVAASARTIRGMFDSGAARTIPCGRACSIKPREFLVDIPAAIVARVDAEPVIRGVARPQDAHLHPDDVAGARDLVRAGIVVDQDDETGPRAGEIPCRQVGAVVQRGDRLLDLFPGRLANVRFLVDDARYRLDRHPGELRNVVDGRSWHLVWFWSPCASWARFAEPLQPYLTALSNLEQGLRREGHRNLPYAAAAPEKLRTQLRRQRQLLHASGRCRPRG